MVLIDEFWLIDAAVTVNDVNGAVAPTAPVKVVVPRPAPIVKTWDPFNVVLNPIFALFDVIKQDMIIEIGSFYDQPFIIYHSVNNNLVNVTLLVPQVTTSHSTSMNNKENIIV